MMTRIISGGLAYFALVFGAGFVLGVLRVSFLVSRFGERLAELAEMPLMFLVIVVSAICVTRRFAIPLSTSARLGMGLLSLAMLLAAELIMAVALQNRSLEDYIDSRDPVSGTVYLAMLVLFAAMPILAGRSVKRPECNLETPTTSFHRTCRKGSADP
jgi:hypothetical protein